MTKYDLPDIENMAFGTLKVSVFSSQAGLTKPTVQTITGIGNITEEAKTTTSSTLAGSCEIEIGDDHSHYSGGFWATCLFQDDLWLRLYLVEDGTTTFLFFGKLQPQQASENDHYLVGSEFVRTGKLKFVTMETELFDTTVTAWVAEVYAQASTIPAGGGTTIGEPAKYIKIIDLFAAMLSASGLNSSYSAADVSFNGDASYVDIVWFNGVTEYKFSDLYVVLAIYTSVVGVITKYIYWSATGTAGCLIDKFATLQEIVSMLLANFGLIMRMNYDVATDRHKIELFQLGRNYTYASPATVAGGIISSKLGRSFQLWGDAYIARRADGLYLAWYSKKFTSSSGLSSDPPSYVQFDFDKTLFFNDTVAWSAGVTTDYSHCIFIDVQSAPVGFIPSSHMKWQEYLNGAYSAKIAWHVRLMCYAIAGYNYNRFSSFQWLVEREYGEMKVTDGTSSHVNATIMRRHNIDIGMFSGAYFANKITKRVAENNLAIEWVQE